MSENEKFISALKRLSFESWDSMELSEKRDALQDIIDSYVYMQLGINSSYMIKFVDLPDGRLGYCDHKSKTIFLREDIAFDGVERRGVNKELRIWHDRPIIDLVLAAFHEARHAEQRYYLNRPECAKNNHSLTLIQCNNKIYEDRGRVYFKTKDVANTQLKRMATCLYMLQPCERDAFIFAQKATELLRTKLNEMFPDDPEYWDEYVDVEFERCRQDAGKLFNSQDPAHDIDNIILTINGNFVAEPLNEIMCEVIRRTQPSFLYEMLKQHQEQNLALAEKIERGRQFAEENEIDLEELCADSCEMQLYEDAERDNKIGSLNKDDQSPDLSDRR